VFFYFYIRITAARSVFEAFRQTSLTEEDVSTVIVAIDRLIEDPGKRF